MTELLERALQTARALPASMQDEIARIVLVYAGGDDGVIQLTAEEMADLDRSDAEVARGELATDQQMTAIFSKYGA